MKNMLLLFYCLLWLIPAHARIRNGFNPELSVARNAIQALNKELLRSDLSDRERRRMHTAIKQHLSVIFSYQLTEELMNQMSLISPHIYTELNELKDRRGRTTDIYVRFIPQETSSEGLSGASFFRPSEIDEDASYSRYGNFTVAIDIWICDAALNLLAHEFGHTQYIVPNLAAYRKFYRAAYGGLIVPGRIGHSGGDQSGKLAYKYCHRFLRERRDFRANFGELQKVVEIARQVRRNVREEFEDGGNTSVASAYEY